MDPSSQGKLQGAINSLRALTGMIGPLIFTQVFSVAISAKAIIHLPGAPYYLALPACSAQGAACTTGDKFRTLAKL